MKLVLSESERLLLGIISSVECGLTSPEEAVEELNRLKENSDPTFHADYTLEDFERIQQNAAPYVQDDDYEFVGEDFEDEGVEYDEF